MRAVMPLGLVAVTAVALAQEPRVEVEEFRSETRLVGADAGVVTGLELAEDGLTLRTRPLRFEPNAVKWVGDAEQVLDEVRAWLEARPWVTVLRIEGHGDDRALAGWRAATVARWLASKGIDCGRLLPVTFGDDRPIDRSGAGATNDENERVVFVVAERRGRPVYGRPVDGGGDEVRHFCP